MDAQEIVWKGSARSGNAIRRLTEVSIADSRSAVPEKLGFSAAMDDYALDLLAEGLDSLGAGIGQRDEDAAGG